MCVNACMSTYTYVHVTVCMHIHATILGYHKAVCVHVNVYVWTGVYITGYHISGHIYVHKNVYVSVPALLHLGIV